MHSKPVFLSVGGQADASYALEVHRHLGESLAYHYQITGVENVRIQSEIDSQLNGCKIFVVFWSADYLKSDHARNELAYFRKLEESSSCQAKPVLIVVPLDAGRLDIQTKWLNPITQKTDEFALGKWRLDRAIDPNSDTIRVASIINRKLASMQIVNDVLIPRGWLVDQIKTAIAMPNFQARELVFVTGLEGDGRRTALRQFMLQANGQRVERTVALESVDGPEDLLANLMESAAMPKNARNAVLKSIASRTTTASKEVRRLLHESRHDKTYYVIAIDRFIGVDIAMLPFWLAEVTKPFGVGGAPLVFIVTSKPITDGLLAFYPNAGRVRIPGLEENEMLELVHRLANDDPNPTRWLPTKKQFVANASGSSPSLAKSIMRSMAIESNLDFVDHIAHRAEERFGQGLAALMAHWVSFYANKKSDLFALRVIEKLGVASKEAIDEILAPIVAKNGCYDLYTLRDQGLVEQLSDGIYRIPPLIQRRLGSALWQKIPATEIDALLDRFAKQLEVAKTEYGAVYARNAASVAIRSHIAVFAPEYESYLTMAMLFKTGVERYRNKAYGEAHTVLQRAMTRLQQGNEIVDPSTQIEIARFAGLSATRVKDFVAMERSCAFLREDMKSTKRAKAAAAMATFIEGLQKRIEGDFDEAIYKFEKALSELQSEFSTHHQRAAIYTELVQCCLRTSPKQYQKALDMGKAAYANNDVNHTLNVYLKALIAFVLESGQYINTSDLQKPILELEDLLNTLEVRCNENGQDFHIDRSSEYRFARREWDLKHTGRSSIPSIQHLKKNDHPRNELDYF